MTLSDIMLSFPGNLITKLHDVSIFLYSIRIVHHANVTVNNYLFSYASIFMKRSHSQTSFDAEMIIVYVRSSVPSNTNV